AAKRIDGVSEANRVKAVPHPRDWDIGDLASSSAVSTARRLRLPPNEPVVYQPVHGADLSSGRQGARRRGATFGSAPTRPWDAAMTGFASYAHDDARLMQKFRPHLKTLRRAFGLKTWTDNEITAGSDWNAAIAKAIAEAQVFVLLLSPGFIASDY